MRLTEGPGSEICSPHYLGFVAIDIICPRCGEPDHLSGTRREEVIELVCDTCGLKWNRDPSPRCPACGGDDLVAAVAAIVEKSRGTQLSVVGTRVVQLCVDCNATDLERYERNRPNPLMPAELPTVSPQD